jgi:hypothetical protein
VKSNFLKEYGQTVGPLGFPMADKSARALDLLLHTLPRTKEHEYRKAVMSKATTELNPGERSDVSWITTESVDRGGEVVVAKGMNDAQFAGNPLVTLGHAYHLPPVGRSLWRKRVKDGDLVGIKAKTRYPTRPDNWPAESPWTPDQVFALVQNGLLAGKSIGFLPTKAHFADSKEAKKEAWPEGTLVFDEWLLLEYACCYLPVNQDALVESVSKGLLALQPELVEALGLHRSLLQMPIPGQQPAPLAAAGVPTFTALSEVERAVAATLRGIDLHKLTEEQVRLACDKARGRV